MFGLFLSSMEKFEWYFGSWRLFVWPERIIVLKYILWEVEILFIVLLMDLPSALGKLFEVCSQTSAEQKNHFIHVQCAWIF